MKRFSFLLNQTLPIPQNTATYSINEVSFNPFINWDNMSAIFTICGILQIESKIKPGTL